MNPRRREFAKRFVAGEVLQGVDLELRRVVRDLMTENMCDSCSGTGKPISTMPCMCLGTGLMSAAAIHLREEMVKAQIKLNRISKLVHQHTIEAQNEIAKICEEGLL